MKKALLVLGLMVAFVAKAGAMYPTYVSVSTFTPGAALAKVFAFKNGSSRVDVRVLRVDVQSCSTMTVAGGLMQYWVYASTTITNGYTTQTSSYTMSEANGTVPALVVGSTSPSATNYEGIFPIMAPFIVNDDEAATANFSASYVDLGGEAQPLFLPKGANRGLVFEQRRLGTADYTEGCILVRIVYTAK